MAVSVSALQNIDPSNTIVTFTYTQLGSDFLNKTTYHKVDGASYVGSKKETIEAVLGCTADEITCVSRRQGRLGVKLDYKSTIDRAIIKNGGTPIEWVPKEKNGFNAVAGYQNMLWEAIKDGRIALQVYDYVTLEKHYYIKGVEVPKETLDKFMSPYKERVFTINGQPFLINGKPLEMKNITPKSFYLDQMLNLKIKGQTL